MKTPKPDYYLVKFNRATFQGKLEPYYLSRPIRSNIYLCSSESKAYKFKTEKAMEKALNQLADFGHFSNVQADHIYND